MTHKKIIALVAYPGCTALDLIGPAQVLAGFAEASPDYEAVVVARTLDPLPTDAVLGLRASHTFAEVPNPDVVVVPGGGTPTIQALTDTVLLEYLRQAGSSAQLMTSVCTGSLLLGAAGLLNGRRATTHWSAMDLLPEFGATPVSERWVEDGPILTAAGVSAGIDAALHLVAKLGGETAAKAIQFLIEYDPQPPFGPPDWDQAPRERAARSLAAMIDTGLADAPDLAKRLSSRLS